MFAGICFFFIFLTGILFFIPLSILMKNEQESLNRELVLLNKKIAGDEIDNTSSAINDLNIKVSSILSANDSKVSSVLNKILDQKTSGISVTNFVFGNNKVSLTGVAGTRTNLILFVESLKKEKSFKSVNSPVSNLIKEKNLNFLINIGI